MDPRKIRACGQGTVGSREAAGGRLSLTPAIMGVGEMVARSCQIVAWLTKQVQSGSGVECGHLTLVASVSYTVLVH